MINFTIFHINSLESLKLTSTSKKKRPNYDANAIINDYGLNNRQESSTRLSFRTCFALPNHAVIKKVLSLYVFTYINCATCENKVCY